MRRLSLAETFYLMVALTHMRSACRSEGWRQVEPTAWPLYCSSSRPVGGKLDIEFGSSKILGVVRHRDFSFSHDLKSTPQFPSMQIASDLCH